MEVIFLGTGNAFSSEGMDMSSLLIRSDSFDILVDCGPGCLKNYLKFAENPKHLKYIFITHFHGDHIAGLPFLLLYLKWNYNRASFPVLIGPKGIKKRIIKLCELCYKGLGLAKGLSFREIIKKHYFKKKFAGDLCEYQCYPMSHKKESLGYRFSYKGYSIAITGDTGWNKNIPAMAEECEVFITECSNVVPETKIHLSLKELLENIDLIKAKRIVVTHRGEGVRKALENKSSSRIRIPQDGDCIRIDEV